MKSEDFVKELLHFLDFPTLYVNGAFGAVSSQYNKNRYKNAKNLSRWSRIENFPSNGFFADCCGIIKGVLWGWVGDTSKIYGGANYKANNIPDLNELGLINACKEVSTDFNNIQVGEMVYMKGHCGVYIGDDRVIESTPSWDCGVQITGLGNVGMSYNGKTRTWLSHGKLPWVEYESSPVKAYTLEDFREDVRRIIGVQTNTEAFNRTVTISTLMNKHHALVTPLERYFKSLGYYNGEIEADRGQKPDFGKGMKQATQKYQFNDVGSSGKDVDGVITKKAQTWRKLLLG